MKLSFGNRILIPVLVLLTISITIICLVSIEKTRASLSQIMKGQTTLLAQTMINTIESWVQDRQNDVNEWSKAPDLRQAFADPAVASAATKAANAQCAQYIKKNNYFEQILLVDTKGNIFGGATEATGKVNISERAYFSQAMTSGKMVLSEVVLSKTTSKPVMAVVNPIIEQNKTVGLVLGTIDLEAFSKQYLEPVKILKSGYFFICDAKGLVVAHVDKSIIFKINIHEYEWGREVMKMLNGSLNYNFRGTDKIGVFQTAKSLGWVLIATVTEDEFLEGSKTMGHLIMLLGGGVIVITGLVVFLLTRKVTSPLLSMAHLLRANSSQVRGGATQIASASQSLAEGASEQAASLEETSSSLEEMSSMTQQNADNAHKAKELASQAHQAADTGSQNMADMSQSMEAIRASSADISKIIKTIDEIAFQTNILALNAAVEAARAGEAGMGFAVVADEVRNLAQRSAQAARETTEKIQSAIGKTEQGVTICGKVASGLHDIVGKIQQVDNLVAEVAAASREQSQGISQVNTAVTQMDKVVQSTAASAEESASAAEHLNGESQKLEAAVHQLLMLVQGQDRNQAGKAPKKSAPAPKATAKTATHGKPQPPSEKAAAPNGHTATHLAKDAFQAKPRGTTPAEDSFKDF